MANIITNIIEHENSQPISNLMVTWYTTPKFSIPKDFLESKNWEILKMNNWKDINAGRLGSSYTNKNGIARLSYIVNPENESYNLWYTVQSPEIAGSSSCRNIIHVASQIVINATENEEILLRIPHSVLDRFSDLKNLSPLIDSKRSSDDFDMHLEKIERGNVKALDSNVISFSKQFNNRIIKAKELYEIKFGKSQGTMSLSIPMMKQKADSSIIDLSDVVFDKTIKQLSLKSKNSQPDKVLSFKGIKRYKNKNLTFKNIKKPHIIINELTGNVDIVLPKVPDVLELSETEPTPLFMFSNKE
ncbi:hypothetical protein [Aquimarina sp. SS2-1]|uniref:hypothetical protein n=1 Tax=Aquimarina besae TaxID=3342247 RepID=UPI00366B0420